MSLGPGSVVGPYRIEGELGRGGMGVVYSAVDSRDGERVALKVLFPEAAFGARRARFAREFDLMKRLEHPAIGRVHDMGTVGALTYYAMELLPGPTLHRRTQDGAPLDEIVGHIAHIARGLDLAHRQGVVHRDVKAENVLLASDGRARLVDFGLARDLETEDHLTRTGVTLGTRYAMAPEQILMEPLDGRADIFALGVMLYESITGELPFERGTTEQVLASINSVPVPPSKRAPGATAAFDAVCLRALRRRPADRHATAKEFAEELERAAKARPSKQGGPRAAVGILVAIIVLVLFLLLRPPPRPSSAARGREEGGETREGLVARAKAANDADTPPAEALGRALAAGAPDDESAALEAAIALARGGETAAACAFHVAAHSAHGIDPRALSSFGAVLASLGALEPARDLLERSVALRPSDAQTRIELGCVALVQGRFAQAEEQLSAGLELEPRDARGRTALGAALLEGAKLDEADAVLSSAVQDDPRRAVDWSNLARARRRLGRLPQATEAIAKARALEPSSSEHAKEAGRIALARLDLAASEAAFRDALALDAADTEAVVNLAAVLSRQERTDEARDLLVREAAKHPDDERLRAALASLGGAR